MPQSLAIGFGRGNCLKVGIVVVAANVGAHHEYTGLGIQSRAKACALTLDGLISALWVRNLQKSIEHSVLDSVAMGQLTTHKMLHRSRYVRLENLITCNYRVIG